MRGIQWEWEIFIPHTLKLSKSVENSYQEVEDILEKIPKIMIATLIALLLLLGFILVMATYYEIQGEQKWFIIIVLILILTISEFFLIWFLYERLLTSHRKALRNVLNVISDLQKYND